MGIEFNPMVNEDPYHGPTVQPNDFDIICHTCLTCDRENHSFRSAREPVRCIYCGESTLEASGVIPRHDSAWSMFERDAERMQERIG